MTDPSNDQAPPPTVLEAVQRWGLTLGEPAGSRYSHTWFATRSGEYVVVKVGDAGARRREAAALTVYARGAAVLGMAHAPACAVLAGAAVGSPEPEVAMLLERVLPGYDLRPLARVDDDAATTVIGQVIAKLHEAAASVPTELELGSASASESASASAMAVAGPPGAHHNPPGATSGPRTLPALATIAQAFDPLNRHPVWPRGAPPPGLDPALVGRARDGLRELTTPSALDTVLHGDLHHANVVCDGGRAWRGGSENYPERSDWRAIDPHGWFGDPHFDAVSMLLDLHGTTPQAALSDREVRALTRRRARILAEITGLDPARIEAWTAVGAVISELWCLADHGFVQGPPQRLASLLQHR